MSEIVRTHLLVKTAHGSHVVRPGILRGVRTDRVQVQDGVGGQHIKRQWSNLNFRGKRLQCAAVKVVNVFVEAVGLMDLSKKGSGQGACGGVADRILRWPLQRSPEPGLVVLQVAIPVVEAKVTVEEKDAVSVIGEARRCWGYVGYEIQPRHGDCEIAISGYYDLPRCRIRRPSGFFGFGGSALLSFVILVCSRTALSQRYWRQKPEWRSVSNTIKASDLTSSAMRSCLITSDSASDTGSAACTPRANHVIVNLLRKRQDRGQPWHIKMPSSKGQVWLEHRFALRVQPYQKSKITKRTLVAAKSAELLRGSAVYLAQRASGQGLFSKCGISTEMSEDRQAR